MHRRTAVQRQWLVWAIALGLQHGPRGGAAGGLLPYQVAVPASPAPMFFMRLGLFGGSFDPVHLGHLEVARCCQQQAGLDAVWFIPAATQPLKRHGPVASTDERVEMVRLAIGDAPTWRVSRLEIDRGGVSYTVDTLRQLHDDMPAARLFFMMGADALHDLPTWVEPEAICQLATPLVVARAGEPPPDFEVLCELVSSERLAEIRQLQVTMPAMPIASSTIRESLARGENISQMLPQAVLDYIEHKKLYC